MPNDDPDAMGLGVPPPVVFLGPLVLGLLLNRKFPAPFLPRGLSRVLGLPLLSGGVLLGGWFYRKMRRAGTPIIGEPFVRGRPPSSLVTDGPFRYTRNPGYLGGAMIYAGIASLTNALWATILLPVMLLMMQHIVIEREERYLERKFGEATEWYKQLLRPLLCQGVDVFKTDLGEGVPADAVAHNGMTGEMLHNLYPLLYNETVAEVTAEETGRAGMVWGRSTYAGGQRHAAQWSGDPNCTYEALASTLRSGSSIGMCGHAFWSTTSAVSTVSRRPSST